MTDDVCFLSFLCAFSKFSVINMYFLHKEKQQRLFYKKRNSINKISSKVGKIFVTNDERLISFI